MPWKIRNHEDYKWMFHSFQIITDHFDNFSIAMMSKKKEYVTTTKKRLSFIYN